MKQIELIGPVDKRGLAYPLFKLCDNLGKVLVITDDANFRRFSDDYTNEFTLGRSDFFIVNEVTRDILDNYCNKLNSYDYVLLLTTNTLIPENDLLIYCHSHNQLLCTDDVIIDLNEHEHKEVYIVTKKPNDKEAISLLMTSSVIEYIWNCEENKYFQSCKNPEIGKLMSFLFSDVLGVNKEEIPKIMLREEKWGDKQ